ncbi:MAG: LuxR C-terminal-related transcriptional regulator [Treponema sp.]|jgi:LuxR family maltose regulon positive regulatory protein|nr:LuxR C-terminal-related transcriptional regulator [Treponema sp.]
MEKTIYSREAPRIPSDVFCLERPRIRKLLGEAVQSPVVTVSAGEGYGKTWAVYSFLLNSDAVKFWIQISEQDNRGIHLWENEIDAVSLYNPELGNRLLRMGFPETNRQFDQYHRLIERLIKPDRRYILAFDDFHLIHNSRILDFLNLYLSAPFPSMSSVLIYRKEPDINNVALLSKGILARISEEDLRFNREETAEYFENQGVFLAEEDLDHIYHSTEGWPLLLNLVARNMRGKETGEKAYSPELMRKKFAKEIEDSFFSSLSGDMRKLLIKTSLIEHRPRELLERLSPQKELIAEMGKITPMIRYDPYIYGYHTHTILLEFLREKQGELLPEEIRQVYALAAVWCMENGLRTEAARYYEQAGDYRGIVKLVYRFPGLMPGKTAAFFMDLINRQPGEDENGGEEYLNLLRYTVRPKLLFALGRFEEAGAECHRIIRRFESLPLTPQNLKILVLNYICLGSITLFTCRFTKNYQFLPTFEKALHYYEKQPFQVEESLAQCSLPSYVCQVEYPAEKGLFEFSIQGLASVEACTSRILGGFLSGASSLAWSELYYFRGDIDAAEKYARQAVFQARKNLQYETENRGLFFLLRISIHTGDREEIENLFRQLENQLERNDFFNRFILYDIVSGWFYAQIGNTGRMAPWLKNSFEKSELSDLFRPFEVMVKVKHAFSEGRYGAIPRILETQDTARGIESFYTGKLEALLLKSAAWYRLGSTHTALTGLEEAYKIASPQSFDMPFIELGEDMYLLAGAALSSEKNSMPTEWLEKIRNRASAYGKRVSVLAESFQQTGREASEQGLPENSPVPVLRRREEMVLRALSQGFTREEIARHEQISLNAVKEDIKNLYEKLGALNRADAIRIANSMGLLRKSEKSSH